MPYIYIFLNHFTQVCAWIPVAEADWFEYVCLQTLKTWKASEFFF